MKKLKYIKLYEYFDYDDINRRDNIILFDLKTGDPVTWIDNGDEKFGYFIDYQTLSYFVRDKNSGPTFVPYSNTTFNLNYLEIEENKYNL